MPYPLAPKRQPDKRATNRGTITVAVPFIQQLRVGAYIMKQRVLGNKHYPLVLMLEPLFRCNLACPGCGKIDYPKQILDRRLSARGVPGGGRRMRRADRVDPRRRTADPQGNGAIVEGIVARKKFVYLCTNALASEEEDGPVQAEPLSDLLDPSRRAAGRARQAVDQEGVFDKAVEAIERR